MGSQVRPRVLPMVSQVGPASPRRSTDRPALTALCLLALLFCAPALHAAAPADPCTAAYQRDVGRVGGANALQANNVFPVFSSERSASGCVLGSADTTRIPQLIKALRDAQTTSDKVAATAPIFQGTLAELDGFPSTACDEDTLACTAGRQIAAIRALQQALSSNPVDLKSPLIKENNWAFHATDPVTPVSNAKLNALLTNECASGALSTACVTAVDFAAKLLRTSDAMHELVNVALGPVQEQNARFLAMREKQWNSYLNDVSVQYPWELWINSAIFQKTTSAEERAKFPEAPHSKWVVLHPSPGFERVEADTGGHSTTAAVFMEFLGYERWSWDKTSGAATGRWGASVIASAVDSKGSNAVGYGLLLKTPFKNTAVGVVWRNGDRGHQINVAINIDVSKLIQQYKSTDINQFIGQVVTGQQ